MKQKHIDAAREVRLWVRDIIVPTAMGVTTLMTIPEVRQAVAAKADDVKYKIKNRNRFRVVK